LIGTLSVEIEAEIHKNLKLNLDWIFHIEGTKRRKNSQPNQENPSFQGIKITDGEYYEESTKRKYHYQFMQKTQNC
jgi:hypothetical protein